MKNLRNKKYKSITAILLVILLFFVIQVKTVNAFSLFSLSDILSSAVTFPAQVIGYIAGFFTKIIFALGVWLIELALNINKELLSAGSPVIYGWNIVLGFANLGFVLAIIVIAFATILRLENYAMKKILWKLIVAALLVNFSLVIAGVFISVSDIMTSYFIDATSGGGFTSFSDAFAGMFRVQGLLKVVSKGFDSSKLDGANALVNAAGAGIFTIITSLFFVAAFTFISGLTLLAIAIMLIIRYVVLGILLILLPIVWLAWIFPATNKWWSEWWNSFLRWTFFPPIMLFFLYLAVHTMGSQSYMSAVKGNLVNSEKSAAIGLTFGLDIVADLVIVLGLTIGGLIAANKLSLAFASTAYGWAQGAGNLVGRKTWGGVKRGTGGLYNRAIDKFKLRDKSIEASTKAEAKESGRMGRFWHGLKARTFANLSAPTERAVGKYESEVSKLTMAQAKAQHSTAVGAKWVALNEFLSKNQHKMPPIMKMEKMPVFEDIMEDEMMESDILDARGSKTMVPTGRKIKTGQRQIGEKVENVDRTTEWFAANVNGTKQEDHYKRYNADISGVSKRAGMSPEAADAYIAKDLLKFEKSMNKFIVKLKKVDASDTGKAWKGIFANPYGDTKMFAKIIAKSVAGNNSQMVASLLPHLGGANVVNNFSDIYKQELKSAGMKKELDRFEQTIFNNYKNFEGGAPLSAGTEAPKP